MPGRAYARHPEFQPILEHLSEHGPSTVAQMRDAGVSIGNGVIKRLHQEGYIKAIRSDGKQEVKTWRRVWE